VGEVHPDEKGLAGWTVVDKKADWELIYPHEMKK
jgi:hypothetical protein